MTDETTRDASDDSRQEQTTDQSEATADETQRLVTGGGKPCKVIGSLSNASGVGVYGENTASSGENYGVEAVAKSSNSNAAAVRARAPNGARGVYATASDQNAIWGESTNGFALAGISTTSTGINAGTENGGRQGIFGHNYANSNTSGTGHGVRGETFSEGDGSAGVLGEGKSSSGAVHGVKGYTNSSESDAAAVRAEAPNGARGVHATASDQIGVRGKSVSSWGVAGVSESNKGINGATFDGNYAAVYGQNYANSNTSGAGYGVEGVTDAKGADAAGVRGEATPGSGTVHGVEGVTNSSGAGAAGVHASAPNGGTGVYADAGSDGNAITADSTVSVNDRVEVKTTIDDQYAPELPNYPLSVYNTSSDSNGNLVLALKTGATGDPGTGHNFIQFMSPDGGGGTDYNGRIEGDGSGGVTYETSGADYAEHLPKRDAAESIEAGDIVGVFDNHITRRTDGASRVLVVSDAPNVAGNAPDEDDDTDYETVAFTGQVSVTVRGPVSDGDLVVPSGENDGVGVAVAPEEREPGTPVVGQAWDDDDTAGVSEVTVAIGIDDPAASESALASDITQQREHIDSLWTETDQLRTELEEAHEQLAAKDDRIDELETELDAKDERIADLEKRLATIEAQLGSAATPADD